MKTAIFILSLLCFVGYSIEAQQTRGIKPIASKSAKKGTTRAVIIGISDYQDPKISDLKFAHRDAEVFAKYLISSSGGSVNKKNIQLLTNEQATGGRVNMALNWLLDSCKAGDVAIIYFAGHGDVESRLFGQPGYLLFWDTPNRSYCLNALEISKLQTIINTLTYTNKSRVILVSDACHSGNLAGSSIGGPNATLNAMMDFFKNQILILSCQPDEVSIEGEQWGGGRGLFSYYFVDGLNGLANLNKDSAITLLEIQRYLQDKVTVEANRLDFNQTPIIQGNVKEVISYIQPDSPKQSFSDKENQLPGLLSVRSRYYDESILYSADTSVQRLYREFQQAIANKEFLFSVNGKRTADELYILLSREPGIQPVINYLNHNYAAALQDDAQQVLNMLLNVNVNEITRSKIIKLRTYKNYSLYLKRASELLGEEHFMYRNLKARQYFFEGLMLFLDNSDIINEEIGAKIMSKFRQSLEWEPYSPHTYFYMMYCQAFNFANKDSTKLFAEEAMKCSHAWVLPAAYASVIFSGRFRDTVEARKFLNTASSIDPQNLFVLNAKAAFHFYKSEYILANDLYKKIAERDTNNQVACLNLGIMNLAMRKYDAAEQYLNKAIKLDSIDFLAIHYLGLVHVKTSKLDLAEKEFKTAISINPKFLRTLIELARLYMDQDRNDDAEKIYMEIIKYDTKNVEAYYNLACYSAMKSKIIESLDYLERALMNGFSDFESLLQDEDLVNIRELDAFKKLIEKYQK